MAEVFLAETFLAGDFFVVAFLAAGDFFADCLVAFFAGDFLAGDFFVVAFLAGDFLAEDFLAVLFLLGDDEAAFFGVGAFVLDEVSSVVATVVCLSVSDSVTSYVVPLGTSLPEIGPSCIRPDQTASCYWRRVTWTSTNILDVPEPEKIPESGLTSL